MRDTSVDAIWCLTFGILIIAATVTWILRFL